MSKELQKFPLWLEQKKAREKAWSGRSGNNGARMRVFHACGDADNVAAMIYCLDMEGWLVEVQQHGTGFYILSNAPVKEIGQFEAMRRGRLGRMMNEADAIRVAARAIEFKGFGFITQPEETIKKKRTKKGAAA